MPNLLFLFLALLLNYITNLETRLNTDREKAIELKIGSPTVFGRDRNFFRFSYYGSNDAKIIFSLKPSNSELYLIDSENGRYYLENYVGNLTYNGTYYLELICKSHEAISCEFGGKIYSSIIGNTENINLNDNIYYQDFGYFSEYYLGMKKFKVNELKEEKIVYFSLIDYYYYYSRGYYNYYFYPFYPGESPPYSPDPYDYESPGFSNLTIFEIFNVNTQTSERNVRLYKFEPNQEYIIYIHGSKYYNPYYDYGDDYCYFAFLFFTLTNSHIKTFTGEENIIFPEGPMFGIVNSSIQKDFDIRSNMYILYAKTNETIENNLQILSSLQFTLTYEDIQIKKGEANNTIIFFIPEYFENKNKIFFIDQIIYDNKFTTFTIPAHKSMLIQQKSDHYYDLDYVFTYKSQFKNMRILFSDENEDTDYIIQNYKGFSERYYYHEGLPIFIGKTDRDCTITIT